MPVAYFRSLRGNSMETPPPSGGSQAATEEVLQTVTRLKEAIWKRRPILGDIMQKHGGKLLSRYSEDFMDVNPAPGLDERKPELISMVEELVTGRLGAEVGRGVAQQLSKLALVSTADHHSINQHPFFLNAEIISGIPLYEHPDPTLRYMIAFSFASVSVNNQSGFARGLLFNGGVNGSNNLIKLPILADRYKMSVVYGCKPYTREDLTKAENEIRKKARAGEITAPRAEKVLALMEEILGSSEVLGASNFCSQLTRINYYYWPKLFHGRGGQASDAKHPVPNLIYLDIETLVTHTLLRFHLENSDSLLHHVLFDATLWPLLLKHFDGIPGAFSKEKDWGTFLFWGFDEKKHRVRLFLEAGKLVCRDRCIEIELTPAALAEALRTKRIVPSMLLSYLVVSLYYGMKCLGGFCQVHDLTLCKEAWMQLLLEIGETSEAEAIVPVQTKELGGDGLVLAYLKTATGNTVPAMGFDMILDEGDTSFDHFVDLSKRVTLAEMMAPMLPEMYTVLYSEQDRDLALLSAKPEDIFRAVGLEEKLVK